jgi:hypothetical protein
MTFSWRLQLDQEIVCFLSWLIDRLELQKFNPIEFSLGSILKGYDQLFSDRLSNSWINKY